MLEAIASTEPGFILLDAGFPQRTSRVLLKTITHEAGAGQSLPVIVLDLRRSPSSCALWVQEGACACADFETLAEVLAAQGLANGSR